MPYSHRDPIPHPLPSLKIVMSENYFDITHSLRDTHLQSKKEHMSIFIVCIDYV